MGGERVGRSVSGPGPGGHGGYFGSGSSSVGGGSEGGGGGRRSSLGPVAGGEIIARVFPVYCSWIMVCVVTVVSGRWRIAQRVYRQRAGGIGLKGGSFSTACRRQSLWGHGSSTILLACLVGNG